MKRYIFEQVHDDFRNRFREFLAEHVIPNDQRWRQQGIVDRSLFLEAGKRGFLGLQAPKEYGGAGTRDFRYNQIMTEECELAGVAASGSVLGLHNDMAMPYVLYQGSEEQKARWLPAMCRGELVGAIGITEQEAGSDMAGLTTRAERVGDEYIVNGGKTYIGNGINSDLVVTVVRTSNEPGRHKGMTLLMLERGMPGFERVRNLKKVGRKAQDTAEMSFTNVHVPVANRLGAEGAAMRYLRQNLARERMNIAVSGLAGARYAFELTRSYVRERRAFGQSVGAFQNTKFRLAEIASELEIGQAFIDRCVLALERNELTEEEAAMAKWWCTDLQRRTADTCVQFHGGFGYMEESAISWAWRDGRVTSIYGGTNEIMKEIIGRSLQIEERHPVLPKSEAADRSLRNSEPEGSSIHAALCNNS